MARGHERAPIFKSSGDHRRLLDLLGEIVADHAWKLHAYCLMPNHYHLLVETPRGRLSEGMRNLNGRYAQWFNHKHERSGHLFENRFRSIHVDKEAYLLELTRYIVLNPVRARLCRAPDHWEWSSFRATAGFERGPEWLEVDWTLSQFSRYRIAAHEAYWRFVREGMDDDPTLNAVAQVFLGRGEFLKSMQRQATGHATDVELPYLHRHPLAVPITEIRACVSGEWGVPENQLGRRRVGEAKVAAIWLARRLSGLPAAAIGAAFGVKRGRVSNIEREVGSGRHQGLLPRLHRLRETLVPTAPAGSSGRPGGTRGSDDSIRRRGR